MNLKEELLKVSKDAFINETKLLDKLLIQTKIYQNHISAIEIRASRYINEIRISKKLSGVEEFIKQFGLKEKEAIGLLSLAEALLRVPDKRTVDDLITDKLKNADWKKFLKDNTGFSFYSKTFALMLSSNITKFDQSKNPIENIIHRLSEPTLRLAFKAAMQLLGKEFVAGVNIEKAIKTSNTDIKKGYIYSYDMLGEGARDASQADKYFQSYISALEALKNIDQDMPLFKRPNISVKLSALHPRYELLKQDRVMSELYDKIKAIAMIAKKYNLTISLDAEESYRLDIELELFAKLIQDQDLSNFNGIGFVLQAYQKRAIPVIKFLTKLAKTNKKVIPIRLVKGAYWDSEIKWAQMEGLKDYPVFTRKSHTDVSYLASAALLLENTEHFYPQFATHNALTAAAIITLAEANNLEEKYEFQRLYGMGISFFEQLVKKRLCRIYAPVGKFDDLLPYLIRRLMENGVNSNFVNQIIDENIEVTELLKSPIDKAKSNIKTKRKLITNPKNIFKDRDNSSGYCLGNKTETEYLKNSISKFFDKKYLATSIINGKKQKGSETIIKSPSNLKNTVGSVIFADNDTLDQALKNAIKAFPKWSSTNIQERAKAINAMALLIKENEAELIALLSREAGKTLIDAINEIREAIDFCNYYAREALKLKEPLLNESYTGEDNHLSYQGRGVAICISPWNFPLAIFLGQIAAALVAGNSVIAKPAETTSIIGYKAVELFYQAGIPHDVLQFTPAAGKLFGAKLLSNPKIATVAFTGSNQTARLINSKLAHSNGQIAKLIAETGGQNCMIIDSTALLEQATDDIINSSFYSAGQRCSALRVLYVQEDVADNLIKLLKGAMAELELGDPKDFAVDIGPVINQEAKLSLEKHIEDMNKNSKLIASTQAKNLQNGFFVAPHLYEINNINELKNENFGPILHLIKFKANKIDEVINEINSTDYGLTFGIHSRIESRIDYIATRINAGNIYINRNMTGAVVGVQPFGGMGLSGTGPKAGGPNYLKAFMHEKNVTNNITAIGGNLELLSK
jgi:RHH-type transcriptional regulator, proline utilization regulon repressor / proline dehydrogenase / delta 1-pyrroline-5-carboxylate dehydrogenase